MSSVQPVNWLRRCQLSFILDRPYFGCHCTIYILLYYYIVTTVICVAKRLFILTEAARYAKWTEIICQWAKINSSNCFKWFTRRGWPGPYFVYVWASLILCKSRKILTGFQYVSALTRSLSQIACWINARHYQTEDVGFNSRSGRWILTGWSLSLQ